MCQAIPGKLVEIVDEANWIARADVRGGTRKISFGLLKDEGVEVGDWVLIHVGFAISRIDEQEARDIDRFFQGPNDD